MFVCRTIGQGADKKIDRRDREEGQSPGPSVVYRMRMTEYWWKTHSSDRGDCHISVDSWTKRGTKILCWEIGRHHDFGYCRCTKVDKLKPFFFKKRLRSLRVCFEGCIGPDGILEEHKQGIEWPTRLVNHIS